MRTIDKPIYAEIIASGVAHPELAKAIAVRFDPPATAPAAAPAPPNQAPAPSGSTGGTGQRGLRRRRAVLEGLRAWFRRELAKLEGPDAAHTRFVYAGQRLPFPIQR